MSVSSIGGMSPQAVPYNSKPAANGDKEITTITTNCKKNHEHDRSCPHTESTKPAPKTGEPGSNFDKSA